MKIKISETLDWILFLSFAAFIFMAMDILPALWGIMNLLAGKNIEYFPGIFIGTPLLLLLFYIAFIKRQKKISCYIWYIILTVAIIHLYYMIDGAHNRMHIFLYFIASILSFRLLHNYLHDIRLYMLSFLLALFLGILDESMQLFSPVRGFCLWDIKADACAALLGQLFVMLVARPDLKPWIPKLKRKIKGYHAQEKWLKNQKNSYPKYLD